MPEIKSIKILLLCSFLGIITLVASLAAAPAVQASRCNIVQLTQDYPVTANPGQTIQVTTNMGIACAQWRTYYTGRIDLVDIQTRSILSSTPFDIGWMPYVNATAANTATVPQINGPWRLELIIYIFEDGGLIDSMNRSLSIQVGTTTVSTSQTTPTAQATSVGPTTSATQPTVTAQLSTSIPSTASPLTLEPISAAFGALVAGICAAAVVLILRARKRNA